MEDSAKQKEILVIALERICEFDGRDRLSHKDARAMIDIALGALEQVKR